MPAIILNLVRSNRGATAIEYGLIASLIAIGAIAGFQSFGNGLTNMWGNVSNKVGGN